VGRGQDELHPPAEVAASDGFAFAVALLESDGVSHRILSRAGSEALASAMFTAACTEFPGRRILLIREGKVIRRSDT
jgi:hypothetical protein